jgi:hypothetical protein
MTMKRLTDKPVEWCGWKCHIDAGQYDNGRIALELVVAKEEHDEGIEGERVAVATVNLVDAFCGPRQVYVKEWSENEGMTLLLIQNDIIKPEPQREAASGFVVARCYDLTNAAFAKLCDLPEPVVVQYLVSLTLKPGMPATDAPAEDEILSALEVGTEGAPDGMRFEGVEEISVQDKGPNFYTLDDAEHATVLAALRYYESRMEGNPGAMFEDIATNGGTVKPLTESEIDALCERLNCGG